MTRLIHLLIGLTYGLGAVVAAAALMRLSGAPALTAWTLAGLLMSAAAQLHRAALRRADDRRRDEALEALRHANLAVIEEMEAARARAAALESALAEEETRRAAALAAEVERLERAIRTVADAAPPLSAPRATPERHAPPTPLTATAQDVREAIDARRVDLLMQPIVTLPQRRTAHFEAFTHLRTAAGRVLPPSVWLPAARQAGLLPEVDALLLGRCVRIARRLSDQDRRQSVFCNLAPENFSEPRFSAVFRELREAADVADSLVLELRQRDFRALDAIGMRNLMRVADFGFRFALDQVEDLDEDLAGLRRAHVRFMKVDARRLLVALTMGGPLGVKAAPEILAADYPLLLQRYGVSVIAEKLETEPAVIETLDFEITLGQGRLFGAPRPVRDDIIADVDADLVAALDAA